MSALDTSPLTGQEKRKLASIIERDGLTSAARLCNVTREAAACAIAGLQLRRGTLILIRQALNTTKEGTK